ncbi:hypothetical protein BBK82_42460 [Lentzea guizhouensis]|uniref:Histidine kinase/HSP90-like ATPase domain-containing protein n=1 Tax=Lentzea guizhouensis TaxID=1586287 RepID=A0A1B2I0J0_9PSEU|nr:hypothetical protein BBK82_42460 [Lentzea guizhouensis]
MVVDLSIEPGMSTAVLRGGVGGVLHDLGEDHRYDVLLVVTELASNVHDHACGVGRLRVFRSVVPCRVWVEVDDEVERLPVYGRSRLGEDRGRGMMMVDGVSLDWGTRSRPGGGKTVYTVICCGDVPFAGLS